MPRLADEVERSAEQLEMFADAIQEAARPEAITDRARASGPSPDPRRMLIPLGPVALLGASNFPFAFGPAAGDTASAGRPDRGRGSHGSYALLHEGVGTAFRATAARLAAHPAVGPLSVLEQDAADESVVRSRSAPPPRNSPAIPGSCSSSVRTFALVLT